jgi:hypothetical protein
MTKTMRSIPHHARQGMPQITNAINVAGSGERNNTLPGRKMIKAFRSSLFSKAVGIWFEIIPDK